MKTRTKKYTRNTSFENKYRLFEEKYYNEQYFNDNYTKCNDCGEYHLTDEMTDIGGREYIYICESCLDDDYCFCEDCEKYHNNDDMIQCDGCGKYVCKDCSHSDGHNTDFCQSCYDNCSVCEDCGCFIAEDYICYCEDDGCNYCEDCIDNHNNNIINNYDYKPDYPDFYGEGKCYLGIELEVDKGNNCQDTASEIIDNNEEIYCKHDSSLDDGFEIVSHPCTLEYHMESLEWENIMKTCLDNKFKSHNAETCGLHVHISREGFGDTYEQKEMNTAKLIYIFEKFWNQIKKFSRRTEEQINQWAKNYGLIKNLEELLEDAKGQGRYYAVNLCNSQTIEIRIFRGTLKYSSFIASLQFCQLLVDIVKKYSTQEIQNLIWEDITEEGKQYNELTQYFIDRNLITK